MIALLLALVSAQGSALFTYRTVAIPAGRAVYEMGKLAKADLSVAAPLDREPLILRLENAKLDEVMAKVAATLHAEWQKKGPSYILQRQPGMVEQLRQADIREREALLREQLKRIMADAQLPPKSEAMAAEAIRDSQKSRVGRHFLTYEVLAALDLHQIAEDEPPTRNAYSTQPKPLQRPIDLSPERFQQMILEQNLWTAAARKAKGQTAIMESGALERHMIQPDDAHLVALVETSDEGAFEVNTAIVNGKGDVYVSESESLLTMDPDDPLEKEKRKKYDWLALKPVKLSAEAIEMRSLVGSFQAGSDLRPASSTLRKALLDPEHRDPLSWTPSEVLLGIGDQKEMNVVATLSDSELIASGTDKLGLSDPTQFLLSCDMGYAIDIHEGWLTMAPKHPLSVETLRSSRAALGDYIREFVDQGYSSIETEAAFLADNAPGVECDTASSYARMLIPTSDPFAGPRVPDVSRFYGLLSQEQRALLGKGGLSRQVLNAEQLDALARIVAHPPYSDYQFSGWTDGQADEAYPEEKPPGMVSAIPWQPVDELTEYLDEAVPVGALARLKVVTPKAVKIRFTQTFGDPVEEWLSAEQAAATLNAMTNTSDLTFASGGSRELHFRFQLTDNVSLVAMLGEHGSSLTPWGPLSGLPRDVLKAIQDRMKEIKDQREANMPGDRQPESNGPPPPH